MAKTDIAEAFWIVPVEPSQYHLMGIHWRGEFFYDRCLAMGLRQLSTAVHWTAVQHLDIAHMVHLTDNVLIVCLKQGGARSTWLFLPPLPWNWRSTVNREKFCTKHHHDLSQVRNWQHSHGGRTASGQTTKVLKPHTNMLLTTKAHFEKPTINTWMLNFACAFIMPGRAFLRRMIDLTIGVSKPFHFIPIMKQVHDDLNYEARSCQSLTIGPLFFLLDVWSNLETLNLFPDASGSLGYRAVFGVRWLYGEWSEEWKGENITLLALYHIVLAVTTWSASLANQCNFVIHRSVNAYAHKVQGCKDPTAAFFIQKLPQTCHKQNQTFDTRLPIDRIMLHQLTTALCFTITGAYCCALFQVMFLLALLAFLRIGEITVLNSAYKHLHHQLQSLPKQLMINFLSFKLSSRQPFLLKIEADKTPIHCPVKSKSVSAAERWSVRSSVSVLIPHASNTKWI